jgi:hypothetical protein
MFGLFQVFLQKVRFTASGELQCCDEVELQPKSKSPRGKALPEKPEVKSPRSPRKDSSVVSRISNLDTRSVFEDDEYQ